MTWLFWMQPQEVRAADDVVTPAGRLEPGNSPQADKIEDRGQIYQSQVESVSQATQATPICRRKTGKLAEKLLDNGKWLAANDDPVAEGRALLAMWLTSWPSVSTRWPKKGDVKELDRVGFNFRQVTAFGVDANLPPGGIHAAARQVGPCCATARKKRMAGMRDLMTRIGPPAERTLRNALEGPGRPADASWQGWVSSTKRVAGRRLLPTRKRERRIKKPSAHASGLRTHTRPCGSTSHIHDAATPGSPAI